MKDLNNKTLEVIQSTRNMLLPYFGKVKTETKKDEYNATSVVTKLDKQVEKFLTKELKKLDPSVHFVGEEYGGSRNHERFWLCDPIDGTAHFIRGMPFCTTMLALVEHGEVVFSAIYDFVNDNLYHAEKGKGAFNHKKRIQVSNRSIKDSYVSIETKLQKEKNLKKYKRLRKHSIIFKTISSGFEMTMVASGKLEARVCLDPYGHDYDFAPGAFLIKEAGGVVTNIGKNNYDFSNVNLIAANPAVHKFLTSGKNAIFPIKL